MQGEAQAISFVFAVLLLHLWLAVVPAMVFDSAVSVHQQFVARFSILKEKWFIAQLDQT